MRNKDTEDTTISKYEWIFTAYMERVIRGAKINYINRVRDKSKDEISIDTVSESLLVAQPDVTAQSEGIDFTNDRLEAVYHQLPVQRRLVLEYTYSDGLTVEEIAMKLNCSIDSVYALRSRVLRQLKKALGREDADGKL